MKMLFGSLSAFMHQIALCESVLPKVFPQGVVVRPTMVVPDNRKQSRLSLCAVETHTRLCVLFNSSGKTNAFLTLHFTAAAFPRLTGHGPPPNLDSGCSTKMRVLAAKFDGRRWSVS